MKCVATFAIIAVTACRSTVAYRDPATGYSVSWQGTPGIFGWPAQVGDRGEPGEVNPAVIEYIFAAPEGPFARYYDLVLSLLERPSAVNADLAALDAEARKGLRTGTSPRGRDYARALGRKLARAIRDALAIEDTRFAGIARVHWGVAVDLDHGIPIPEYKCNCNAKTRTHILRYQSLGLIVVRSSALRLLLVWDVSEVPGAFQWDAPLDQPTVAARIAALHSVEP